MRIVRGLGALLILAVLLCAVPWVIVTWGAWGTLLRLIQHPSILLRPDDGSVVLAVLTLVGSVFWIVLAVSIIIEFVAWVRSRGRPRASTGHGVRSLVRPLIAAVFSMAVLSSGTVGMTQAQAGPPITIVDSAPTDRSGQADGIDATTDMEMTSPDSAIPSPDPPMAGREDPSGLYVVKPGDSLWSIAQKAYGNGRAWVRIAEANSGLIQGSGDLIHVGWQLVLPPPDSEDDQDAHGPEDVYTPGPTVVVQEGDSLWHIADQNLGDPTRWEEIAALNSDVIVDPEIIHPGDVLTLPSTSESDRDVSPGQRDDQDTYVGNGDDSGPYVTGPITDETQVGEEHNVPVVVDEASIPDVAATNDPAMYGDDISTPQMNDPPVVTDSVDHSPEQADEEATLDVSDGGDIAPWLGVAGLGVLIAGGLTAWLRRLRTQQLRERPVGRRIVHPSPSAARLETALGNLADKEPLLHDVNAPLAEKAAEGLGVAITLGRDQSGDVVVANLEDTATFHVQASAESDLVASMTALCVGLASGIWSSAAELHVVTNAPDLFIDLDNVVCHPTSAEAMTTLRAVVDERRDAIGDESLEMLRLDPNMAEAYRPIVFAFLNPHDPVPVGDVAGVLIPPGVGVSALVGSLATDDVEPLEPRMSIDSDRRATLYPSGLTLTPSLLDHHDLLADLLTVASTFDTTTAWWSAEAEAAPLPPHQEDTDMLPVPTSQPDETPVTTFSHPTLMLLGPISLDGVRGQTPTRAERACMEYCGWLLEHPGATATAMTQSLLVAEGTRRSNMSRLRAWLGTTPEGASYLPEAYSGRIWLDSSVSSDWHRLCLMVASGVEATDVDVLLEALHLVRGIPLADAAPGQWHWAEELRTDMVSLIRDIGVVAARKCLNDRRIDDARWAVSRALSAAQEDELLLCCKIEIEHAAGNRLEVERLVSWVIRNARTLGVDLLPDTAALLRDVVAAKPQPGWSPS